MYDINENYFNYVQIVNMAAAVKCVVLVYLLFNVCYYSPTETVMPLLNHCSRFYSHADRNMAENLIVPLKIAVDSVYRFNR